MSGVLISTTNTFDNAKIIYYYGAIATNLILGVDFWEENEASVLNSLGVEPESLRNKLDRMYAIIEKRLENKAFQLGANAIVGLRIDFDEVSGKGKQMFMATATGTACIIEKQVEDREEEDDKVVPNQVTDKQIKKLLVSRKIKEKLEKGRWCPSDEIWDYIISNHMLELADLLTKNLFKWIEVDDWKEYWVKYREYIGEFPYQKAVDLLYPYIKEAPDQMISLIEYYKLFNAKQIIKFIEQGEVSLAIRLLFSSKDFYEKKDVKEMEEIINKLESLPDKGKRENVVSGLFSKKEEEMYICPNGHKNKIDEEFCSVENCGLNIKGLTFSDIKSIEAFKDKVDGIKELLSQNISEIN